LPARRRFPFTLIVSVESVVPVCCSTLGTTEPAGQLAADAEPGVESVVESVPDDRSIDQRRHDAFEHADQRLLAAGDLPATAGVPTTLIISMTLDQLEARAGQATTHHGGHLSVQAAMRPGSTPKPCPSCSTSSSAPSPTAALAAWPAPANG